MAWLAGVPAASAQPLWRCPAKDTVVQMMEIDPARHSDLKDLQDLRDRFPASTRQRPQTWTYGDSKPVEPLPVCAVTQKPAVGAATDANLEAGIVPLVTDPNADQIFRTLAIQLTGAPGAVARLRTPIVRSGDPMVGNDAAAAWYTNLGISPRRGPNAPDAMPAPTDILFWQDGTEMIEVENGESGKIMQRSARRFQRCDARLLNPQIEVTTFWVDQETGVLLRRFDKQRGLYNPMTGRCVAMPMAAGTTGVAAIRLTLPTPPPPPASPQRPTRRN